MLCRSSKEEVYKSECKNYRPITKLSVLDKIFEEVLLNRLKQHTKANKIINEDQFGFVENSNTLAACIKCVETIYEKMDRKRYIALLSIDLVKAFDSVIIDCLLNALYQIGITGNNLEIYENFLNDRKQFVHINNVKSETLNVKCGVPQGSKLASQFFIIIINSIFKLTLKGKAQFWTVFI